MTKLSRRDFLKLTSIVAAGALAPESVYSLKADNSPNIIIILFDAMSARNMSLYGYSRETTHNLSKFADRSTVYFKHYSGGNYTTPGTASMLTGMFQWKHRAFNPGGLVKPELAIINPFTLLGEDYYRLMFSQNLWPDRLVSQYYADVDRFLPMTSYSFRPDNLVMDKVGKDRYLASISFEEFLFPFQSGLPASSVLGYLYKVFNLHGIVSHKKHSGYPRGVPEVENFANYLNEEIYKGVLAETMELEQQSKPYFSYFHLFSPHEPYKPGRAFWKMFENDGFEPPPKPVHPSVSGYSYDNLLSKRLRYDQQVAHVDAEFGKLIERLESTNVLDNSYIIVTSDHGEMFERGFFGHSGLLMYEPNIRIPLLIRAPGQETRKDIQVSTSNIDLLPTILSIAEKNIPAEIDGQVLPGLGGNEDSRRPLFSMNALKNSRFLPITRAAISMHQEPYKLIAYLGFPEFGLDGAYELYDLENDPEEMVNLTDYDSIDFSKIKEEFLDHLADANRPYLRNSQTGG
ncbi:MAG: sulfatase-like hydrolase/transferase [Anaerolineales bacterium]|nr:sulfatase-like hydrolase/transferase [Anaerolineales bacterium]